MDANCDAATQGHKALLLDFRQEYQERSAREFPDAHLCADGHVGPWLPRTRFLHAKVEQDLGIDWGEMGQCETCGSSIRKASVTRSREAA